MVRLLAGGGGLLLAGCIALIDLGAGLSFVPQLLVGVGIGGGLGAVVVAAADTLMPGFRA